MNWPFSDKPLTNGVIFCILFICYLVSIIMWPTMFLVTIAVIIGVLVGLFVRALYREWT